MIFWIATALLVFTITLRILNRNSKVETIPEPSAWEKDRKNNGMKIIVDLTNCEIQTATFRKEKEDISYLDELGGIDILIDAGKMPEPDQFEHSVLIYEHKTTSGKTVKFYGPTSKNKKNASDFVCDAKRDYALCRQERL